MLRTLDLRTNLLHSPVTERDHVLGPPDAPVTLVEYGDFECPYSQAAYPMVRELIRRRGPVVRFVYRHFPRTKVHPHAEFVAEAAEAAGAQGKFWPMHDWLFTHRHDHEPVTLAATAEQIGLDTVAFAEDLATRVHLPHVREDVVSGLRSGVTGTPTFFANGTRATGGYSLDGLLDVVDAAIG